MLKAHSQTDDPLRLAGAMTAAFAFLCLVRLTLPSQTYFDEVHYVPAAKALLEGGSYINREHPLLGKHLIALGMGIFGENAFGWRIMPLLAGMIALFAMMRTMWFATLNRFATTMFGFYLATGFLLLIHARIAMLDIFMLAGMAVAAWQFSAALREHETAHRRLLFTGIALGAAMGAKWNAIPLAVLPGLTFFTIAVAKRWAIPAPFLERMRQLVISRRGGPIPGVSLLQAVFYLGIIPLAVYAVTFLPAFIFSDSPLAANGLIGLHEEMFALQSQVLQPHPYQSAWWQWLLNLRGVWYMYEVTDGAQRGVLLIGNPASMLLGLPAIIWCAYSAYAEKNPAKIGIVFGFAASIGLWLVADKSVQFYYHYLLPSTFLLAALALACEKLWDIGERGLVMIALGLTGIMFAYFYPILTAGALSDADSFGWYTWIDGWV
jgi:dolichyl-phosphate-mannose--protein O-mannosyl transferase